ncbi:EamA family transporter [Rhodohalobacter sp. SW132]|uniref:DMT family transporter n=1 Tax=Rhodohalobacter sp. SW132 TaxID=2293433 RepID=UPI000E286DAD|nr:DMT family transporter [Rhodohalobacter sp. SW132]REL37675.1 EamA family transporter [Rhodohalobacter sp. SW132]
MKQNENQKLPRLAWAGVLTGAALWGTLGLFIAPLTEAGFPTLTLAFLRMAGGFILALPLLWIAKPGVLKLNRWQDLSYFILTGTVSLGLFQWFYLSAINELGMSLAVVLLYTAPAFVVIMARFLFGEPITLRKTIAICIMVAGCVFVLELPAQSGLNISVTGFLLGMGAAITFALYNVSSKFALQKYSVLTVTIYTFLFAAIGLMPLAGAGVSADLFLQTNVWVWLALMMVVPTLFAYGFYMVGLQKIESGRATLAAVIELLVAVLLGVIIAREPFSPMMGVGVLMVLSSVLMISLFRRDKVVVR